MKIFFRAYWIDRDGWIRSSDFDDRNEAKSFLAAKEKPLQVEEWRTDHQGAWPLKASEFLALLLLPAKDAK